jgi:hypothetical protein
MTPMPIESVMVESAQAQRRGAGLPVREPRVAAILPRRDEAPTFAGGVVGAFRAALSSAAIFVIDNGSIDGTYDASRAQHPISLLEQRRLDWW